MKKNKNLTTFSKKNSIRGITLFLTEKCNLNCSYCFLDKTNARSINKDLALKSMDYLFRVASPEAEYYTFTFFGGEPLLEKKLIEELLIRGDELSLLHNKPILYNIVTNGTLIDENFLKLTKKRNFALVLSWDGQRFDHDLNRASVSGKSYYKGIQKMAPVLAKRLLNFTIRMTVTPQTACNLFENFKYIIRTTKINSLGFVPTYEANWKASELQALKQELIKISKFLIMRLKKNKPVYVQPFLDFLLPHDDRFSSEEVVNHFYMHRCAVDDLAIDTHGNIYPCHRFVAFGKKDNKMSMGNVLKGDFSKKKFEAYLKQRELLRSENPNAGGCPAVNFDVNGDVTDCHKNFEIFSEIYSEALQEFTKRKDFHVLMDKIFKR